MQALTVAIVLAGLTYFFPGAVSQFSDRIGEVGFFDYGRLAVAGQALIEISQKPILGWGITHFDEAGLTWFPGMYGDEPQRAHVTLLLYWYGAGILGATGFLALFVIPARNMIRVLRGPPCKHTNAVRLMLACYVCFFIVFNLGPYLHNRYLYIPLFVFAGYAARARGSVEAPSALRRHALSSRPLENPQPST
jgi:O-antigen ligase